MWNFLATATELNGDNPCPPSLLLLMLLLMTFEEVNGWAVADSWLATGKGELGVGVEDADCVSSWLSLNMGESGIPR